MHHTSSVISVGETSDGTMALTGLHISCANAACNKTTSEIALRPTKVQRDYSTKADYKADAILVRRIRPEGNAKPQPDCVPQALVNDYTEACLIRDLSPKASATLIRRCLQGMIRDFAGISDRTLFLEIAKLREALQKGEAPQGVTDETVDAIDHVRKIGNIGAHMEVDIDHIVEVEPGEAEALIALVEMLFAEWYVARQRRHDRLAQIAAIATDKDAAKSKKI